MTLFHSAGPYWDVCLAWFLSAWVGIVVVAPLVIGIGRLWREPPSRGEWIEGVGVFGLTAFACLYTASQQTGSWLSFSPSAFVLPLLLWLTARCQPTFGIAGAFLASIAIIFATTFGVGRFGDAAVPIAERVRGAQVGMMTVTIFTLVLTALFAQRKEAEESLAKERTMLARLHGVSSRLSLKRDLHQALDEILAGAIELMGADMGAIRLWDSARGSLRIEAHRGFACEYLDLFRQIPVENTPPCKNVLRSGERMVIEDVEEDPRFAPFRPLARAAGYRALQSTRILSREGVPLGVLGTHFRSVHKPNDQDLRLLDFYVRQAADIIEHHRAEVVVRASEERLRLAQLKTGVGVWDWDLRADKITWTPELAAIYGVEPGYMNRYADFRDRVHPDDIEMMRVNREAAVQRGETFRTEFRIIRPDGKVRWLLSMGGAVYDAVTGEPTRILGNNIDITERKEAELALAERNMQLALAGKASLVGTFAYDLETERVQVSESYAAIYDFQEGTTEIAPSQWRALVHPDDLERLESRRCQAFADGRREYGLEYRIVLPNRGLRWIETRSFISYDAEGHPQRVVGVNIDITERRRMEQALTDRNRQLELAGKAALVGSFAIDLDTAREDFTSNRMHFSPGYAAIYGLPEETMEISVGDWRSLVQPDDLSQFLEHLQQTFSERRGEHHSEFRIVRPCGTIRWIETRSFIEYDQAGYARRMVGVNIDITERKRAEAARKILNAELDHRVKNSLATVSAVISQTRQASRSLDGFVDGLEGRIRSMATTHELLSFGHWQGVSLTELIRRELEPYAARNNTEVGGPHVVLKPEAGQAIAMVLHELATNAAKYGALTNKNGRVSIRWDQRSNGRARSNLVVEWKEIGGPPVVETGKTSYGTSTIRHLIPYEFGGTVDLMLDLEGVRCRVELPAHWLSEDEPVSEAIARASRRTVDS